MGPRQWRARMGARLKEKAPRLHRFLVRGDRPYPAVREALGVLLVLMVLVAALWGLTGQRFPRDAPVVVVESGSMMHCENLGPGGQPPSLGRDCDPERWGRIGTIDPGDLIFVRDIQARGDVTTLAAGGEGRYGKDGDVIIFHPDGNTRRTPVIHRALFWLEVHANGTFSVPEVGIHHVPHLNDRRLLDLGLQPGYADVLRSHPAAGPDDSGWVTRGDNNALADQGSLMRYPVQPDWVLGKARGELPWIGLVKLLFTDLTGGQGSQNYHNAPGDSKVMLFVSLGALVGGPWLYEYVRRKRHAAQQEGAPADEK